MSQRILNVQSFPRPPLLEKISRHIQIKWMDTVIVDTKDAYWVLETHHPPSSSPSGRHKVMMLGHISTVTNPVAQAYYLPPDSVKVKLSPTPRKTFCEWKGAATYYAITAPGGPTNTVQNRVWSYDSPTRGFEPIQGYLSFYAGPWDCFVDGEKVEAQPGDFYGGWVTSEIQGIVKGKHGNFDPVV